ncbi:metallophosphoesterase [Candidatus Pacearchaeota archaeon]|nr:metallophosphoesterase [Candidatus Pacearchaeota archaeon]
MRSLVLFDLHYQHNNPISKTKLDKVAGIEGDFDSLILGGDNAELSTGLQNHRVLFERLRRRFECPIAFVLGNHELWGKLGNVSSWRLIYDIFPELGKEYGFTYLESENLDVESSSFVGTYGHFDYSFLRHDRGVSIEDLLRGTFIVERKKITWKDKINMDWEGKRDGDVCVELVDKFSERIKMASGKPISFSHTIPRLTLNGWPDSPSQYFMEAYSGSNLIGDVLQTSGGEYHFCGHTHARANDKIGKTIVVNVGSDYNLLRYVILDREGETTKLEEREIVIN